MTDARPTGGAEPAAASEVSLFIGGYEIVLPGVATANRWGSPLRDALNAALQEMCTRATYPHKAAEALDMTPDAAEAYLDARIKVLHVLIDQVPDLTAPRLHAPAEPDEVQYGVPGPGN